VIKGLTGAPVDVSVIDRNNFHVFQPLLYQVATAGLDIDNVSFPIRGILRRNPSANFRMGSVTAIDLSSRTVTVDDERTLAYDYLVIAAGTVSSSFGIGGVDEHTFPLKTLHDAVAIKSHFLSAVERESAREDHSGSPTRLGVVIVGGGPTGVEMAGGIRELLDRVLDRDFPRLPLRDVPITLIEAADRVLGPFHPKLSAAAEATLRRRGVEVLAGTGVDVVEPGTVVLADGRRVDGGTIIWAAGVTASPVAQLLGIALGRGGRIPVGDDLSLEGHPEVFAIGDIAMSPSVDGRGLPQVAQPAIQGGAHVARQIRLHLAGEPTESFSYLDKGSMATIGRSDAVVELPHGLRFKGRLGWIAWLGLHIVYLMGFRNRVNVFVNWCWNYLTYDRGARIIVERPE
jgi:NADH dehydrogenase